MQRAQPQTQEAVEHCLKRIDNIYYAQPQIKTKFFASPDDVFRYIDAWTSNYEKHYGVVGRDDVSFIQEEFKRSLVPGEDVRNMNKKPKAGNKHGRDKQQERIV